MEKVLMGLSATDLAMLVVFLGLILLIYIMIMLVRISKADAKNPSAKLEKANSEDVAITAEAVEKAASLVTENSAAAALRPSIANEEIAAIAAVMAIITSEGIEGTITAVRPLGPKLNLWALAGRRDIMASRL
jgi:hypothetical protein